MNNLIHVNMAVTNDQSPGGSINQQANATTKKNVPENRAVGPKFGLTGYDRP